MLDEDQIDQLFNRICDRYTAEELCEIIGLGPYCILEAFKDDVLEINWEPLL